jgi:hypothetical protein
MLPMARTIAVPLTMRSFSSLPEDLDDGGCLTCGESLELHQPDTNSPDRMVGICAKCGCWYLLDTLSGTNRAVMVRLPDGDTLRKVLLD